jgi:diguanylate cyclase (GGDEF)-like protein
MPKIALLLTLLLTLSAHALNVSVDDDFQQQQLAAGLKYWLTDDHEAKPPSNEASEWQTSPDTLTFGFDKRVLWTHFTLSNSSSKDQALLLEIEYPLLDVIDITITNEMSTPILYELGDTRPLTQSSIQHPHILAPLTVPKASSVNVMMRIHTAASLNVPMTIWNSHEFLEQSQLSIAYYVFVYGILIGIALYHFVLFIQMRELGFLWFSLFIVGLVAIFAYFQGFLTSYVWPQFRDYSNQILVWLYAFTAITCNAYILRILNVKRYRPSYARSQYALMAVAFILIALSFLLPYDTMIRLLTLYAAISVVVVISVQIRRGLDRYTPAYYAIGAGIFCAAGMIITILEKTGAVTSTVFTRSAGDVGFTIMAILYALSLSYRMKWEQAQRKIAQQETVDVQADLLKAQTQLNIELESLVKDRTLDLEKANNKLKIMSVTDALTGLFNRRYFDQYFNDQYKISIESKNPIGLLLIDIDHFKNINDTYGHTFGDHCLASAAKRMQTAINTELNILARYGGEEFIIVLPNSNLDATLDTANKILSELKSEPITQGSTTVTMTASIGAVSETPGPHSDPEHIIKKADDYLYEAKRAGRDQTISERSASHT